MSTSHCAGVNSNEGYRISKQVGDSITTYYWKDLQGDITGILDETGEMVVSYTYDAWGRPLSCTGSMAESIGQKNPFRYRGYYYDAETGLYYLNSRYYDSVIGRFISADDIDVLDIEQGNLLQYNLYTYCLNNPVNIIDSEGTIGLTLSAVIGGAVAGVLLSTASYAMGCLMNGEEVDAKGLATAAVTGAVCGGVGGALGQVGFWWKVFGSACVGAFSGIVAGVSSGNAWKGVIAGFAAAEACFVGSIMDFDKRVLTTMIGTGVSSIVIGAPIEIASLTAQNVVSNSAGSKSGSTGNVKSAGRTQNRSTQKRTNSYAYRPLGRWTIMSDLYGEDWKAHYQY